ncbi:MAG: sodium:proton antiporter [Gammaproteobacteria bacterium]|jgi:tetracycline resistance efflux pump|nr:sodium:proton antiporter [Gammaproteobacteria bacterium]
MENYGAISLIPTVVVIIIAVISHRPIAALLAGVVVGICIHTPDNIIGNLAEINLAVMQDETIGWVIMVCGLMGSLIYLLIRTGGASAFAVSMAAKANSRNKSLLVTWFLGMVIFIDDYLNAIAIGSSMKKVTDKYKVSRAMLSYVVDSTAAPTCVIVPISTWAVFFAGVLEATNVAKTGEGMMMYISGIPYMAYPFVAILMVPLVACGKFPLIGLMKVAESKAQEGIFAMEPVQYIEDADKGMTEQARSRTNLWVFLLPLFSLIAFSFYFEIDLLKGIMATLAVSIPMFVWLKLLNMHQALDSVMDGFKIMLPPLAIVVVAFMFKEVNDQLGLPQFIIESVKPLMSPVFLPLVTFWSMALIAFATGSSWGVFAIAIPIIMPLAAAIGTPTPLVVGALLSASSFGSHACFYGDATVLSAQSSGISVMEHALTQLPYALIAAVIASFIFIGFGLFI